MAAPSKKPTKKNNEVQVLSESTTTSNIIREVLDLEINNILHDVVLKAHRQYRAEQDARPNQGGSDDKAAHDNSKPTQNLPICPSCNLPRLLYPTKGSGSRPPPDPSLAYCANQPPVKMPGHDVNGNPFATDKPPYKSKMKKAQREAAQATSPQPSQNSGSPPVSPTEGSFKDKAPTSAPNDKEKPFVTFPERKCPNPECQRYMPVARIAKHLDRCLGISGRQSSRNAMEKMGTGSGNTPVGSRAGTPSVTSTIPNVTKKRAAEDEDTGSMNEGNKKKKLKLSSPKKKDLALPKEKKGSALKNGETIGETVVAVKKED